MTIPTKITFKDEFAIQVWFEHDSIEKLLKDLESVKKLTKRGFGKAFSQYAGTDIKEIEILRSLIHE